MIPKSLLTTAALLLAFTHQAQWFLSGPVTGAVTAHSASITVQTSGADTLRLLLKTKSGKSIQEQGLLISDPFGFGTFEAYGLHPSTRYAFNIESSVSKEKVSGSFTTFPEPGSREPFSFVTGSCQETANMKVFDVIPSHDPLFFMHTGDYTYPDYQIRPDYSAFDSLVAFSYRRRYNENRMKEMLCSIPIDYVFDDNDHVGSSSGRYCKNSFRSEKTGWFGADAILLADTFPSFWLRNVIRGYDDYFPHYPLPDTAEATHHSFVVGNAEIFVLDRNSSRPYPYSYAFKRNKRGRWEFDPPEDHCMFCETQMEWLKEGLKNSEADWKFIVSGVPLNRSLGKLIDTGLKWQRRTAKGYSAFHLAYAISGYWAGYPHEMNAFYDWLEEEQIKDVIVISGDTHNSAMDDGTNSGLPEMNASGLSVRRSDNTLWKYVDLIGKLTFSFRVKKDLWNKGGTGITHKEERNAFGKVHIEGNNYVELTLIDEENAVISSFKVPHSSKQTP